MELDKLPISLDLAVTIGVILATQILAKLVRSTLESILRPGLLSNLLLEGVATFELCAVSFENGLLFETHGKRGFFTGLFLICLWRCYHWRNVSTLPYTHLESWIRGRMSMTNLMLFLSVQMAFGSLAYRWYVTPIWELGLSSIHTRKIYTLLPCRSLVRVEYLEGMLVEFGCTFACGLLIRLLFSLQSLTRITPVLKSLIITSLIFTGFDYTGGFMSPVLATVKQYGCTGFVPFQHFIVYWVGDNAGGVFSGIFWDYSARLFNRKRGEVKKKTS